MADPKYRVMVRYADKARNLIQEFVILEPTLLEAKIVAAAFPVSKRYTQPEQQERAYEYCEYLNRLDEAVQEAAKRITLVAAVTQRLNEANSESTA